MLEIVETLLVCLLVESLYLLECGIYAQNTWSISRFECGLKLVEQEMKCIPWYLPQVYIPY